MSSFVDSERIKQWGREIGFDLVGITSAQPVDARYMNTLKQYLENGYHGEMHYLWQHVEKRLDVRQLVPGARSVICAALNYYNEEPKQSSTGPCGRVARFAWGLDYHEVVKHKLHRLADRMKTKMKTPVITRCFVDTAPVLEKALAARAGLGWIGKNTLLINKQFGSWLVLGEIVTNLELDYDPPAEDQCGHCEHCLNACPTNALIEPRILNAGSCISYLTVESKSQIPTELQPTLGNWFFGCDECQNVCPFNRDAVPCEETAFKPQNTQLDLDAIRSGTPEQLRQKFADTNLSRMDYNQGQHIAMICKQNKNITTKRL